MPPQGIRAAGISRSHDALVRSQDIRATEREFSACDRSIRLRLPCVTDSPTSHEQNLLRSWMVDSDAFFASEFGPSYVAAVFHSHETCPHLHHYVVGPAAHLHPGLRAELENGRRIEDDRERLRRYRQAMRDFLDKYCAHVGCKYLPLGASLRELLHEGHQVSLTAPVGATAQGASGGNVHGGDQGLSAAADVLELAPTRSPRHGCAVNVLVSDGLDPGLLIDR